MRLRVTAAFLAGVALAISAIVLFGAGGSVKSPTGAAPDRYVYYPGTEQLGQAGGN